ncbi:LytR C-terminal domain-containing protein [Dermatobacter hominis]|uniref:LytR C-terminal domain-containing protein n=1 Tax=Dermatobacter hominis TaxID=2884263 RepID=UPI001D121614|nr:LytR C-terminal domain-containing protein [Dermatobacter hominis]UDY35754.1 LytR C-terminal domain-containing protein [Dermatobacter hominis]
MTATDSGPTTDVEPPAGADPGSEVTVVRRRRAEQSKSGGRARRGGVDRGRTVWWQLGTTLAFVALLVGLAVVGYRASLLITGGGTDKVTDPKAPGYVAEVRPTPVDLVAVTTDDGTLAAALIVSSSGGDAGGTVSALPATMSAGPGEDGLYPPIGDAYATGGLDELRSVLGTGLTFGFTSAEEVAAGDFKAFTGLAGPLTVKNVDNLIDNSERGKIQADPENESVRYRAGDVVLQPDEVITYLGFAGVGEKPDRQMLRHLTVWEQLLNALKGKDLSAIGASSAGDGVSGGGASAVAELLSELEGGTVRYEPVPLVQQPIPGTYFTTMVPDAAALPTYVARVVPFPTSATPGQRARVELLNGTSKEDSALLAAPKVVAAGGEISLLGNAGSFDVAATEVEYLAPEAEQAADEIAKALGVTATEATSQSGGIDVRVTVGGDRTS